MQLDRIDAHTHLGRWLDPGTDWMASDLAGRCDATWAAPDVDALLDVMDAHRIAACVNLDGRWGDELEANLERYDRAHPARFATFCHVDWGAAARGDDFAAGLVAELRRSAAAGARGLKVWKTLGLGFRDAGGELLLPDDPRCAPVFAAAGELGLPVLIHTADPRPFFDPAVDGNPRLDELREHPEWSYANGGFPTHERLRRALLAVVEQHPGTCFVAAHVAASADELGWVGRALAAHPNLCIDLAAREDELAAHPGAARHLFLAHPDRVLFGTDDIPLDPTGYQRAFGFLDGLGLPGDVLAAIYAGNARRILGETERSSDAGTA